MKYPSDLNFNIFSCLAQYLSCPIRYVKIFKLGLHTAQEQTHLHFLTSGEHEFSDEANGCRFSTHMDLLSTQTWSCEKHETKTKNHKLTGIHTKKKKINKHNLSSNCDTASTTDFNQVTALARRSSENVQSSVITVNSSCIYSLQGTHPAKL